jgi:hypothetical protein
VLYVTPTACPWPCGKRESDRIGSRSVAGFAVEGQIASGDVNHSVAATWRWICAGEVDLHVTLASHRACRRLVTALTRMDIVVAVSLAPINGHPYVFQQISVLILVLGGVRSADRKYRAGHLPLLRMSFGPIAAAPLPARREAVLDATGIRVWRAANTRQRQPERLCRQRLPPNVHISLLLYSATPILRRSRASNCMRVWQAVWITTHPHHEMLEAGL